MTSTGSVEDQKPAPSPSFPHYGPPITLSEAMLVAESARRLAAERDWPMVIAVLNSAGHIVLVQTMDQAQYGSVAVAIGKARCAVEFRRPTESFQAALEQGGVHLRLLSMEGVVPIAGGIPLYRDSAVVGAIGISGMTAAQDAEIAAAGAEILPGRIRPRSN